MTALQPEVPNLIDIGKLCRHSGPSRAFLFLVVLVLSLEVLENVTQLYALVKPFFDFFYLQHFHRLTAGNMR